MVGVDLEAAAGGEVAFTDQASRVRWPHESRRDRAGVRIRVSSRLCPPER
jgi:hypothetical protein